MKMSARLVAACGCSLVAWSAAHGQHCPPSTLPPAPINVLAHDGESCEHTLVEWTAPTGSLTSHFRVWRAWMGDLDGTEMVADGVETPFYFDTDALAGDPYTYWVQAISPIGCASETSSSDDGFRRPQSPGLGKQPGDVQADPGQTAAFDIVAFDASGIRWRKDGVDLVEGEGAFGVHTSQLIIPQVEADDVGYYDALLFNECGQVQSESAELRVGSIAPCKVCPIDYDNDGGVDQHDLEVFFTDWEQAAPCADVSRDGGVDFSDIDTFVELWSAGTC